MVLSKESPGRLQSFRDAAAVLDCQSRRGWCGQAEPISIKERWQGSEEGRSAK